jgi:hypothetical protein
VTLLLVTAMCGIEADCDTTLPFGQHWDVGDLEADDVELDDDFAKGVSYDVV